MAPCQSVSVASTTSPVHLPPLCYVGSLLLTSLTALPMIHSLLPHGEMYYDKRKNFVFFRKEVLVLLSLTHTVRVRSTPRQGKNLRKVQKIFGDSRQSVTDLGLNQRQILSLDSPQVPRGHILGMKHFMGWAWV